MPSSNLRSSIRHVDYRVRLDARTPARRRKRWLWAPLALLGATGALVAALQMPFGTDAPDEPVAESTTPEAGTRERRVIPLPGSDGETATSMPVSIQEPQPPALTERTDTLEPETNEPDLQAGLFDPRAGRETEGEARAEEAVAEADTATAPGHEWHDATVRQGESMAQIFQRLGLSARDLHYMARGEGGDQLARIRPGQELRILVDADNKVQELILRRDRLTALRYTREGDSFTQKRVVEEPERRIRHAEGTINRSLFLAGREAGLSDRLIMQLTNIFAWDVDFVLDIRQGDHFYVIYEELYHEDEHIGEGRILAAEFNNRDEAHRAVHFETPDGRSEYYTPDGHNVRRAFIRTPVEFTRVSSRFGPRRHPITQTRRDHKGVDYAAPTGTPIKAAGDGVITHFGTKGGYGKTVIIRHGQRYTTLYAHMSRYASGLSRGSRVRQGQTIGYVGQTGFATGPHLHYEFRVDGVHKDPQSVELPQAEPIEAEYRKDFERHASPLLTRLDNVRETHLAQREE